MGQCLATDGNWGMSMLPSMIRILRFTNHLEPRSMYFSGIRRSHKWRNQEVAETLAYGQRLGGILANRLQQSSSSWLSLSVQFSCLWRHLLHSLCDLKTQRRFAARRKWDVVLTLKMTLVSILRDLSYCGHFRRIIGLKKIKAATNTGMRIRTKIVLFFAQDAATLSVTYTLT